MAREHQYVTPKKKIIVASLVVGAGLLAAGGYAANPQFADIITGEFSVRTYDNFDRSAIGVRDSDVGGEYKRDLDLSDKLTNTTIGKPGSVASGKIDIASRGRDNLTGAVGATGFTRVKVHVEGVDVSQSLAEKLNIMVMDADNTENQYLGPAGRPLTELAGEGVSADIPVPADELGKALNIQVNANIDLSEDANTRIDSFKVVFTPERVPAS